MTETPATPITDTEYRARVAAVQHTLRGSDLDGVLCLDFHDVVYLTGFFHSPNERPVGCFVPTEGDVTLYVPLLEREHAAETWIARIETYEEFPGHVHPAVWMAQDAAAERLGVDGLELRVAAALEAAGVRITLTDAVERLRWRKSARELDLIRTAARFADRCLEHVLQQAGAIASSGGTELDILAAALAGTESDMRDALGTTFDGTPTRVVGSVHTGPQAALPHGRPGLRRPGTGDVLIAGIGVAIGGYHAESGATFVFGRADDDQRRCLLAAEACDREAREACRPGVLGEDVNEAGLRVLRDAGLGGHIRHRIGHGMGLQGHESPWLAPGGTVPIAAGMVFSNEPGIYRPGVDGYRTINTMIVHDFHVEVPSRFQATHAVEQRVL
ncbi:MAG: aminopeptidase P family protein [Trueperaceae bacterium]|nr:MAG: aminopeptidase P family protein [Trueperaceae bacterium]